MTDAGGVPDAPPVHVVGWDATPGAHAALELVLRLRDVTGARVIAAAVYGAIPVSFAPFGSASLYGRLEGILRADAENVLEELRGVMVERRVICASSVPHGLNELAVAEGAELVAVGATHHRRAAVVASGGVPERLIHGAPCAVAVAPAGRRDRRIERIAVGFDGRDPSRRALDTACALAGGLHAQLLLIGVVEPVPLSAMLTVDDRVAATDAMRADMDALLSETAAATPTTLRPEIRVETGFAGAALTDACAEADVDLLVLGTRAYGSIAGAVAGSVSREIVDRPPCPVIVVPAGAATSPGRTHAAAATHD
jgi:nucleotide-binding universal stress UspA family protein